MHEARDLVLARRFQQREGAAEIGLNHRRGERMLRSTCDSAAKCTIASGVLRLKQPFHCRRRRRYRLHEAIARMFCHRLQIFQVARIGQLVQIDHVFRPALAQRQADESGADEAGASSNKKLSFVL